MRGECSFIATYSKSNIGRYNVQTVNIIYNILYFNFNKYNYFIEVFNN